MPDWLDTWLSYRPSDFLMFSPATYARLVAAHTAAWWPLGLLFAAAALVVGRGLWQRAAWAPRAAWLLMAAACGVVAWGWHFGRYAAINAGAVWLGAGFALQAVAAAVLAIVSPPAVAAARSRRAAGAALGLGAVVAVPLLGALLAGHPQQAQAFGLMPDPTLLALFATLLLAPPRHHGWAWWLLPALGAVLSALGSWTLAGAAA
jgi:hypothetical protein